MLEAETRGSGNPVDRPRVGDRFDTANESDHNLIWHYGQPVLINQTGPKDVKGEQTWEAWQRRGFEQMRDRALTTNVFVEIVQTIKELLDSRVRPAVMKAAAAGPLPCLFADLLFSGWTG